MISLYANISSIRWDYGSSLVKGFITSADGSGIKSFELVPACFPRPQDTHVITPALPKRQDKTQTSSFAIANQLWDLMDA